MLASLYPKSSNPSRLCKYLTYKSTLRIDGLAFRLDVRDVPKFEKMNESISINLLCIGDEDGFTELHVSKHPDRPHRVNLLLLEGEDEEGDERKPYVCIKNISAFVCGRTSTRAKCTYLSPVFIRFATGKPSSATNRTASVTFHNM